MAVELFKLQLIYHNLAFKKSSLIKLFLLATTMASIPCFNLFIPIDGCDPSWTIEATKVRLNSSDLDASFRDLMAANWLIDGYETLSIGRGSARAVMVLKKLGFADAMGVYRSCASLFGRRQRLRPLPFNEGSFDFVFSTEMIDGVRVPARLVLEMERVLRPARIGVVMRRVSGNFPMTAMMKAAAPVAAFLRFSDVVAVRTVNCTVMVVFKKRTMVGHEKHKAMEQKESIAPGVMTKSRDTDQDYESTSTTLKQKNKSPPARADLSVVRKSTRDPITEMPPDYNVGSKYATTLKKQQPLVDVNNAKVVITEMPRKLAPNYVAAYETPKKRLMPPLPEAGHLVPGRIITEMSRGSFGKRYLLNMPPFGTKKRKMDGG